MKVAALVKKIFMILQLIGLLSTFTGCSRADSAKDNAIRIGFFPNITHSQALIGMAEGQFQEFLGEEYTIEWNQFNAGPEQIEALMAGAIDIGYIGPTPAINGHVRTKGEIQIIAGATDGGAILVSRKDLEISSISELAGKKVAVPQFGNTQDLSLRNLLLENNLKETTRGGEVEVIQVSNPDIKTLLDSGEIDLALVPEPWGARLIKEIGANIVLDYDEVWKNGNYNTAVVIVRKAFLDKNPEAIENFLKAHIHLTQYINEDKEKAQRIVNKQIEALTGVALPEEVLKEAYSRLIITDVPTVDAINEMVQLSVEVEFLQGDPDTSQLLNLEIYNRLISEQTK